MVNKALNQTPCKRLKSTFMGKKMIVEHVTLNVAHKSHTIKIAGTMCPQWFDWNDLSALLAFVDSFEALEQFVPRVHQKYFSDVFEEDTILQLGTGDIACNEKYISQMGLIFPIAASSHPAKMDILFWFSDSLNKIKAKWSSLKEMALMLPEMLQSFSEKHADVGGQSMNDSEKLKVLTSVFQELSLHKESEPESKSQVQPHNVSFTPYQTFPQAY